MNLSRFHFCTAFRWATGQIPHEWLTALRISEARWLLAQSEMPVTSIALAVGYQTPWTLRVQLPVREPHSRPAPQASVRGHTVARAAPDVTRQAGRHGRAFVLRKELDLLALATRCGRASMAALKSYRPPAPNIILILIRTLSIE
ncbi:helix-turn-helix domain-containing protein [Pseudoroseomonas globiformis]|uniref:Helix-turn-helix domain-containing protein n=1 Tax=Teichococcus globiformis TaxID=2307229 RepID=A0ABV7FVN6_9PROT